MYKTSDLDKLIYSVILGATVQLQMPDKPYGRIWHTVAGIEDLKLLLDLWNDSWQNNFVSWATELLLALSHFTWSSSTAGVDIF